MDIDVEAINIRAGLVLLSDGSLVPIVGYFDHSSSCEEVEKFSATQIVAGSDEKKWWSIEVARFNRVEIH
jgi:hypothetical protein